MSAISAENMKSFSDTVSDLYTLFFKRYPFMKPFLMNIFLFSSSNFGIVIKEGGFVSGRFSVYHSTEGNIVREGIKEGINLRITLNRKHYEDMMQNKRKYMEKPYKLLKFFPAFLRSVSIDNRGLRETELSGSKVTLRPGDENDFYLLHKWYNDTELNKLAGWNSSKVTTERLRYNMSRSFGYDPMNLMIDNEEGTPIGTIQLYDFNEQDKNCKLGIRIGDRDYWSKGYGGDAVKTILEYAFMKMDMYRVTLKVYEYNERAVKCYLKCGFQCEGRIRQSAYIDGKFYDEIIMGALKSDFIKLQGNNK
ncbi:MAG: GNAT family protein [Clostridiaceae bacterium]|nr:GNAT family protein [Clostridiaceae bacterium]